MAGGRWEEGLSASIISSDWGRVGHNKDIKTRQYHPQCLSEELENRDRASMPSVLHHKAADLLRKWSMFTMTTEF